MKPCPCGASKSMKGCVPCTKARRKARFLAWYQREQAPHKARRNKITAEDAAQIRALIAERDRLLAEARKLKIATIAEKFDVSVQAVEAIQRGRSWKTTGARA